MPLHRSQLGPVLVGTLALVTIGFLPATPAQADPDIEDVQATVDRLYHEAEQAQERHHDAELDLAALREDLAAVRSDEARQDRALAAVREQVTDSVLRQYQGQGVSAVGQVVVSDDPSTFLGQLSTMSAYNDMQTDLDERYATELEALDLRRDATAERTEEVAAVTATLAEEKDSVDAKLAEAEDLLGDLEEEERRELLASRAGTNRLPSDVPASGRARAAVEYAMAQVGDSYVYGAAGESAFDCSGLTMRAWGTAGVGLPHSSSAQFGSGPHISQGELQPGDLVFYYSPISHVGIYVGNGLIVHAANPGAGVRVDGVNTMPYVGAVRPG